MSDNKENSKSKRESNNSQSRNNNGTIGGEGGYDKEPKGSFHKMTERLVGTEPVNERGIRENEENHSLGDEIKNDPDASYAKNEIDPNKPGNQNTEGKEIVYPKKGYNHVDNAGGTSAEDLEENNKS